MNNKKFKLNHLIYIFPKDTDEMGQMLTIRELMEKLNINYEQLYIRLDHARRRHTRGILFPFNGEEMVICDFIVMNDNGFAYFASNAKLQDNEVEEDGRL